MPGDPKASHCGVITCHFVGAGGHRPFQGLPSLSANPLNPKIHTLSPTYELTGYTVLSRHHNIPAWQGVATGMISADWAEGSISPKSPDGTEP